jgi:hypothetical protein
MCPHGLVAQRLHQENAPVAVLNTRSLPFRVITPLFRVHFHLFFVCETYAAACQLSSGSSTHETRLFELRQHEVVCFGIPFF